MKCSVSPTPTTDDSNPQINRIRATTQRTVTDSTLAIQAEPPITRQEIYFAVLTRVAIIWTSKARKPFAIVEVAQIREAAKIVRLQDSM